MNRTSFSLEIFGDRLPMLQRTLSSGDNRRQLEYIKEYLKKAINEELTERQKEIIELFFFKGKTLTEISELLSINKSTVSRHISRSKEKLKNALQYGLFPLWYD